MSRANSFHTLVRHPLTLSYYAPSLIFSFAQGLIAPILPLYMRDLGVSYGLVGLLLAGEGLGALLGDVPAGMLLRRLGKKKAMSLGLGCVLLSTAALFWAGAIPEVFVYRLLAGFGRALYAVSRHAYIADATRVANRGRAVALSGGIFRIGRFAGPALGGTVAAAYGLRAPFVLFGGVCAIALVVIVIFVRVNKGVQQAAPSRSHRHHLFSILRAHYRVLVAARAGQLFAQMIRAGRRVIIPLYAADVLGLDMQAVGFIVSISLAIDMTLFYPAGWLMDHRGRKFAIVPSFLIQAIGLGLVPLTGSFESLALVATLVGFGNGLGSGTMMTLGADLAPQDSQGEFLGVWRLIGDGGSTGAPLVVGTVADLFVLPTAAWAMSGAGLMAALIFTLLVPETLKRRRCAARLS